MIWEKIPAKDGAKYRFYDLEVDLTCVTDGPKGHWHLSIAGGNRYPTFEEIKNCTL
jgi:hypothetical protein